MLDRTRFSHLAPAFAALIASLSIQATRGDDPPPIPSDPVFRALRIDGTTASGRIRQMGPKNQVVLSDGTNETVIPFESMVKLTRDGDAPTFPPDGSVVVFPDGDRLRAQIGNSTETTLETHPPLLGELPLPIPLDSLLAVLLSPASEATTQESALTRLQDDDRKSEVLLTTNGDRITGGFLGIGANKISFQRENGPPEIDRSRVSAIEFDPKLVNYPVPAASWLELTFNDGSRLGVIGTKVEQGQIVATTRFGASVRLPLAQLSRVHVMGGPVSYLSGRKPAGSEFVGYVGDHRKTFGRNRTVSGQMIRLSGQPYDRGIGTQSRTLLAYRLDPKDLRFQATVGVDDRAGDLGNVVFRVLVDGKERFASPPMTSRDAPRTIDIDLKGARVLILATEFGNGGDVQDLADWAEARIIQATQ